MDCDPIILDYALVALRMLNNKYDEKMEEDYLSMLDLALGFIPEEDIHSIQVSCEIPDVFKLYGELGAAQTRPLE